MAARAASPPRVSLIKARASRARGERSSSSIPGEDNDDALSPMRTTQQQQQRQRRGAGSGSGAGVEPAALKWSAINRLEQGTSRLSAQFDQLGRDIRAMQLGGSSSSRSSHGHGGGQRPSKTQAAVQQRTRSSSAGTGSGGRLRAPAAEERDLDVLATMKQLFQETMAEVGFGT